MSIEEWQRRLRTQFASEQPFRLENIGEHPIFSDYRVTNPARGSVHRVAIRSAEPGRNYCSCADFRTNLSLDGRPAASELTARERARVTGIIGELVAAGVGFAAIDCAGDYLMEVNLANPGGLATLARVYGRDFAPAVVSALTAG